MQSLYSLSINGDVLYFLGKIPEKLYSTIDQIAKNINFEANDFKYIKYQEKFLIKVFEKTKLKLTPIKIDYVFRKQ